MNLDIDEKQKYNASDEIDLIAIAKTIWDRRRTIIKTITIFTLLGLFIAIFSKKEYTASAIVVPQMDNSSSKFGGLSSLASLAGFNMDMNNGSGTLSPILYPKIVGSINFQLEILNTKFSFKEVEEQITLFAYYKNIYKPGVLGTIKTYTFGLPRKILKNIRKSDISTTNDSGFIKLSKEEEKIRVGLEEKLFLKIEEKEGYLTIVSNFHQPELSAQIAQKALLLLQEYITQYKIEKATADMLFIQERYNEKKKEFENAQSKLAAFRDANKNITSAVLRTQEQRLEYEYQLAFDVYSELAKQLEQSLIKVKEETPVFSVIEEVTIPSERAKPNRTLILVIWIFLGIIIGIAIVIIRSSLNAIMKRWNEA